MAQIPFPVEAESAAGIPPRTLVIFADGTGNSFSQRETNIWRLYCDLDKGAGDQMARYIPGVGTSSIGVLRWLDAAIGFGVPANVRKLYRFLCWNWREGDRIVLIGFSRGAFTVRTLAGLIAHQGLMPSETGARRVTTAEMRRNANGAWRAYRAATTPRRGPVRLWRAIGTACVTLKRKLCGQPLHGAVCAGLPRQRQPVLPPGSSSRTDPFATTAPTQGVTVDFMGVFETVEAFGLPIDELRRPFGVLFYPLSFQNGRCAASVRRARHALAVDEERQTFLAVRFEREAGVRTWQDISERWFPGVHSDIGGGYPDDHNAMAPLAWMRAELAAQGVRFLDAGTPEAGRQSPRAPIHDSRSGFAVAYRYQPRRLDRDDEADPSLAAKIRDALDGYAPIAIPKGCRIAGGQVLAPMAAPAPARVAALMFCRRLLNRILVLVLMFFLLSPWFDTAPGDGSGQQTILQTGWQAWWFGGVIGSGLPGAVAGALGALGWFGNRQLEARIHDVAGAGWRGRTQGIAAPSRVMRWLSGLDRRWLDRAFVAGLLALLAAALVQSGGRIDRSLWARAHCVGLAQAPALGGRMAFDPSWPCMQIAQLRAGHSYRITLTQTRAFCDAHIAAPVAGFDSPGRLLKLGEPLRRAPGAPWFAPLVQVGRDGPASRLLPAQDPPLAPGGWACPAAYLPGGRLSARITAAEDGPLFLYVNDMRVLPGVFYGNNSGAARVQVVPEID